VITWLVQKEEENAHSLSLRTTIWCGPVVREWGQLVQHPLLAGAKLPIRERLEHLTDEDRRRVLDFWRHRLYAELNGVPLDDDRPEGEFVPPSKLLMALFRRIFWRDEDDVVLQLQGPSAEDVEIDRHLS
jgi:hypothetical protein